MDEHHKLVPETDVVVTQRPLHFNEDSETMEIIVKDLVERHARGEVTSKKSLAGFLVEMRRKYPSFTAGQSMVLFTLRDMIARNVVQPLPSLEGLLRSGGMRSQSGVLVVAIFTSPYPKSGEKITTFSCPYDCHYCPAEPDQPRSYLLNEPGVKRANRNNFDCVAQFYDRCTGYYHTGHPVDKVELLVLGGTWSSYPSDYQETFIRDTFYAANTFFEFNAKKTARERLSLREEQQLNETAQCRVIGLTIETRPDRISPKELVRLREFGVTRVQMGIQHVDNAVLEKINRQATNEDSMRAMTLLKDNCFKVDIHVMPDLPGSDVKKDEEMFEWLLHTPHLQADQWKIYPCQTTPWTKIKEWYDEGSYVPYGGTIDPRTGKDPLFELLLRVKNQMQPWIRLSRVIRDIPGEYIEAGNPVTNMRQTLAQAMKRRGFRCRCLRCREVKDGTVVDNPKYVSRIYESNGGEEHFLTFECGNPDVETLYAFLRLRLTPHAGFDAKTGRPVFPELADCALIRELHVYGQVRPVTAANPTTATTHSTKSPQHVGLGSQLLKRAEAVAVQHGYKEIAVIAAVGTKEYYRRRGYADCGHFLIKQLNPADYQTRWTAPHWIVGGTVALAAALVIARIARR